MGTIHQLRPLLTESQIERRVEVLIDGIDARYMRDEGMTAERSRAEIEAVCRWADTQYTALRYG